MNKGETVDMPVFFYIDPEFGRDINMRSIDTITLSYTFFSEAYPVNVPLSLQCLLVLRVTCGILVLTLYSEAKYDKNGHLTPVPGGPT